MAKLKTLKVISSYTVHIGSDDIIRTKPRPFWLNLLTIWIERKYERHSSDQLTRPEGIAQQFPQEVVNTRKRLYPVLKKARDSGKEAS